MFPYAPSTRPGRVVRRALPAVLLAAAIAAPASADFVGLHAETYVNPLMPGPPSGGPWTTYRVFATFEGAGDQCVALSGDDVASLTASTLTTFWQETAIGGDVEHPAPLDSLIVGLHFDSYWTIGSTDSSVPPITSAIWPGGPLWTANSFTGDNGSFVRTLSDPATEAEFDPPSGQWRVLIGQFTVEDGGGLYVGGRFYVTVGGTLEPVTDSVAIDQAPPTGACCTDGGVCAMTTHAACDAADGAYQGDFTTCEPNPCPQPGACCFPDGSCLDGLATECGVQGGAWQGPGFSCDPNPCPPPPGACCLSGDTCEETTEADCIGQGGTWQGALTGCAPDPCAPPPYAVVLHASETLQTNHADDEFDAAIDDGVISYTRQTIADNNVMTLDVLGVPWTTAIGNGHQYASDVWGWEVVWTDTSLGNYDIMWTSDFRSGVSTVITSSPVREAAPAFGGDVIVWEHGAVGSEDLHWLDLSGGGEQTLTAEPWPETDPAIDGTLVAWRAYPPGSNGDIHASVLGGTPFIVASGPAVQHAPRVQGNLIVYVDDDDVAVYDHATGTTVHLTNDAWVQKQPQVDGRNVLWVDNRNGNNDVFVTGLDDGIVFQLTSDASDQVLTDVDNGVAVFHDDRYGNRNVSRISFWLNHVPVADAGLDRIVLPGDMVELDGIACDPDTDPECGQNVPIWEWTVESAPLGATYDLIGFESSTAMLFTDPVIEGDYVLGLRVFDGWDWSEPDTVVITGECQVPVFAVIATSTDGDRPLTVQFDMSLSLDPSGTGLEFEVDWGDGTGVGPTPVAEHEHVYDTVGIYTATPSVMNGCGKSGSISYTITVRHPDCDGDISVDANVGFADLNDLLAAWGPCPGCLEDLNGDGVVGFADLNGVLSTWGPCE